MASKTSHPYISFGTVSNHPSYCKQAVQVQWNVCKVESASRKGRLGQYSRASDGRSRRLPPRRPLDQLARPLFTIVTHGRSHAITGRRPERTVSGEALGTAEVTHDRVGRIHLVGRLAPDERTKAVIDGIEWIKRIIACIRCVDELVGFSSN